MYDVVLNLLKDKLILCRIEWVAVFTAGLLIVAWWQLGKINKTSSADFLHRFKIDFFNDITRILITLVEYKCFKYVNPKENGIPYFDISLDTITDDKTKGDIDSKVKKFLNDSYFINAYDIDDILLGHFEDMGILNKKKVFDIEMIYEAFSPYIKICWENDQIWEYIRSQREEKEENWDLYDNFEDIYNKCESFYKKKERKERIMNKISSIPIINWILKRKR